jgi:hypothetical protein
LVYLVITLRQEFGTHISPEAKDLITQLCAKDPRQRLCCVPEKGVDELRKHPFFADFDWTMLFCRRMPSPFRGSLTSMFQPPTGLMARELAQLQRKLDSFVPDTLTKEQQVNAFRT